MGVNIEGPVSALVTDAMKFQCTNCNGSKFYISTTMDDPIDVVQDTTFAALMIEASGAFFCGLVCLCVQCGHQQVPFWYIKDTVVSDGGTLTFTDLDTDRDPGDGTGANTTTNLLKDLFLIYCGDGVADTDKYYVVNTNNAAEGVAIVPTNAPADLSDGEWILTNILPTGYTAG